MGYFVCSRCRHTPSPKSGEKRQFADPKMADKVDLKAGKSTVSINSGRPPSRPSEGLER